MTLGTPDILEIARQIRNGEATAEEVTALYLGRIATTGRDLRCIAAVNPNRALAEARAADAALAAGQTLGALHGVPIGLKDICDLEGYVTGNGSHLSDGDAPAMADCVVAQKLKAAGAIIIAKTETHEFAIGGPDPSLPHGPALNPWNTANYPGGSSSGSGAAVAAGVVPAAIGTDTGGSIRIPAGYCGLVGMKPTYGRVSRRGISPLAYSLDHAGPMTWTVADNIAMLQAIAGHDPLDPASAQVDVPDFSADSPADVKGMRIGILNCWHDEISARMTPDAREACNLATAHLAEHGAIIEDCVLSPLADYLAVNRIILLSEAYTLHEADFRTRPEIFGPFMRERLAVGALFTAADYVQALRRRSELVAEIARAFDTFDLLICVSGASDAPTVADLRPRTMLEGMNTTSQFNTTGNPVLSMPLGLNAAGLPRSVQIVAAPFAEATAYRAGRILESLSRRDVRPDLTELVASGT
ncbi:amidase [Falsirhodobacter sp. alg1]|uniref:amidase n=1 Tax=Falsirhodobacter sp. alg1 TaxID=1472418 RepID=UPI0005F03B05|nr:amidase [Falsirhodobacter sp. alg1]